MDYDVLRSSLEADRERFDISELAFNRGQAIQLSTELIEDEWPMIAFGQGFVAMAGATSELLRSIGTATLRHGGSDPARMAGGGCRDSFGRPRERAIRQGTVHRNHRRARSQPIMGLDRAIRSPGGAREELRRRRVRLGLSI